MTADVIEGEAVEVSAEPTRAVTVVPQPGQAIVASEADPAAMVAVATRLADVLADIVQRKNLYANIQGKRYPTVEAWATIARLDNVVAREGRPAVKHDDGSWEAHAELIRLSDGMVIGSSSALCGDPADRPWNSRADYQKRSMAQTRATSRAFRQQYSWIMALAGYEPTPAEEMPNDRGETRKADKPAETGSDGLIGTIATQGTQDYQLRETPDGWVLPFRLKEGRSSQIVIAEGTLAQQLAAIAEQAIGTRATVWGRYTDESFDKKRGDGVEKVMYRILHATRVHVADFDLRGDAPPEKAPGEAESVPLFSEDEQAAIDQAVTAA